jgi:hypothetical protein
MALSNIIVQLGDLFAASARPAARLLPSLAASPKLNVGDEVPATETNPADIQLLTAA